VGNTTAFVVLKTMKFLDGAVEILANLVIV